MPRNDCGIKIVLIGADGQLGSDLFKLMDKDRTSSLYYPDFDITQPKKADRVLTKLSPDVVINTAAYTLVDECEDNPEKAFLTNSTAVRDLAQVCQKIGAVLVHFSTDYVFDGKKSEPYTEEDPPHPLNVYGRSKLEGENFVRSQLDNYYLIRTCGLYGEAGSWGKGYNFVDAMVNASRKGQAVHVVNDQTVTPTSTAELAQRIIELLSIGKYGLYHMTNEGHCTWFEFAQAIFELLGKEVDLVPVSSTAYGAAAVRPSYSVLENRRAREVGITPFSHWKAALEDYLKIKGHLS